MPAPVKRPPPESPKDPCADCGADLTAGYHRPGCPDDPGYRCVNCLDTRLTRTGGPCPDCLPPEGDCE